MEPGTMSSSNRTGTRNLTFEVLGSQYDRPEVVVFNESANLGCYFCTIPTHNQGLPDSPGIGSLVLATCLRPLYA